MDEIEQLRLEYRRLPKTPHGAELQETHLAHAYPVCHREERSDVAIWPAEEHSFGNEIAAPASSAGSQ